MDSSAALSTQENLWLLLEFKSMIGAERARRTNSTDPKGIVSKNARSAAWIDRKISDDLVVKGLNKGALNFLLQAEYSTDEVDTDRIDRGFRVERVVKNLTDAKRTGASDAPFKLGDQILVTYRMNTRKLQNYVALEDSLPAGLETVNPNLAMIGKFFELPQTNEHDRTLFFRIRRCVIDQPFSTSILSSRDRGRIPCWRARPLLEHFAGPQHRSCQCTTAVSPVFRLRVYASFQANNRNLCHDPYRDRDFGLVAAFA